MGWSGAASWSEGALDGLAAYVCIHTHPPPSVSVPPFGYLRYYRSDLGAVKAKLIYITSRLRLAIC